MRHYGLKKELDRRDWYEKIKGTDNIIIYYKYTNDILDINKPYGKFEDSFLLHHSLMRGEA